MDQLDSATKDNLVAALVKTRKLQPSFNNWLLFSAMIEAFFCKYGRAWDTVRIDYALRQVQEWYKGDGTYGDGPEFRWDYLDSFVIHPMLLSILDAVQTITDRWTFLRKTVEERARRYAAVQERLISPEGTIPPVGRSLSYRFGTLHHLAEMAWRRDLPEGVSPAQVRCAMTAVMTRMIEAPGTFDSKGWLTIGFQATNRHLEKATFPPAVAIFARRRGCPLDWRQATNSGAHRLNLGQRKRHGAA